MLTRALSWRWQPCRDRRTRGGACAARPIPAADTGSNREVRRLDD
jgi:hypothetical protein